MEPQSLNTVPRDGTEVLLWSKEGKNWHQVYFKIHSNWTWLPYFKPYWASRWNTEYYQVDPHFTHWMPLPPPPEQLETLKG